MAQSGVYNNVVHSVLDIQYFLKSKLHIALVNNINYEQLE